MAPCKFKDLKKAAADVLSKDYELDSASVEISTTAVDGTSFKGTAARESDSVSTGLEIVAKLTPGIKLTKNLSSSGTLSTKLEYSNIKGLKLTGELNSKTTDLTTKASAALAYTAPKVNVNAKLSPSLDVSIDATASPIADVTLGVATAYGAASGKVAMPAFVFNYKRKDWFVAGGLNLRKGTQVTADVHHKVNPALQVAVNITGDVDNKSAAMAAGLQYNARKDTFYKARMDSRGVVGASYSQPLNSQVKFTMSAEMRSFTNEANRVGAAFVFE